MEIKICLFKIYCPKLIQPSEVVKYFYIVLYDTYEWKIKETIKGTFSKCANKSKGELQIPNLEKK